MSFVNLDEMFYIQKKLINKIKEDKPEFFKDPEPWEGYRIHKDGNQMEILEGTREL